jgi:hypothetical protein
MTIAAIPTKYNGVQFRSRLEAKWANFFDQMGWSWTYEPIDLRGYIPDFILHGASPILVEVKGGYMSDPGAWDEEIERATWKKYGRDRIYPLLLLGMSPSKQTHGMFETIGGYLQPSNDREWDCAYLFRDRERIGIGNNSFSAHRANPEASVGVTYPVRRDVISAAWARACNASQWKRPHD